MIVPEKNTPAAPAPKAAVDYSDIAKGMPSEEAAPASAPPAAPAPVKTETKEPESTETKTEPKPGDTVEGEGVGTPFEKGFKQLTAKSAALRAREDAVKPLEVLAKIIDPAKAQALARALQSNNPSSVMAALGFTYADVAASVAGGGTNPKTNTPPAEKPEEKTAEPELNPEIAEVLASHRAQKQQAMEQTILNGIKGVVTSAPTKFKTIAGLEDFQGVSNVLGEMWRDGNGSYPSSDPLENITIAAEEYERRLADGTIPLTKKQWEKLQGLTPAPASGSTPPATTRARSGNAPVSSGSTTLTNNAGVPPPAPAATRTDPAKMYSDIAAGMPT